MDATSPVALRNTYLEDGIGCGMSRLYTPRPASRSDPRSRKVVHDTVGPRLALAETPKLLINGPSRVRQVTTVRCPACRRVLERRARARWTKLILRLLRIKRYRCEFCRHRFSEREGEWLVPQMRRDDDSQVSSTFLKPADSRGFRELIIDLGREEEAQTIAERRAQAQNDRQVPPWRGADFVSPPKPPQAAGASQHLMLHPDRKPVSDQ